MSDEYAIIESANISSSLAGYEHDPLPPSSTPQGKFIEKLTLNGQRRSKDGSLTLLAEVSEAGQQRGRYCVCIKMDLSRVSAANIAILVYLDGGPRNFMHLSSVSMRCRDAPGDRG